MHAARSDGGRLPSRIPRWIRALAPCLLTGLLVGLTLEGRLAAESPPSPTFYAVRDAKVVVGNGDVLDRATVLIADGLIEAVGVDLDIPADARVIEGEGLMLFPGFIDAMTHQGLGSDGGGSGGPPGRGQSGPIIRGPEDRPSTKSWRRASDMLKDFGGFSSWREAGFTSVMAVPEDGYFAGQGALFALGEGEPRDQVLASDVAMGMALKPTPGFRTFPGSLMGVLAYVDQTFMDAAHATLAHRLYEASPQGRTRPVYDRALEPISRALEDGVPFLMPADLGREIDRILKMAETHDLELIVYGGQGAYDRLDALAEANVPLLVSLDWPEAAKDRDPDALTPLRDLIHWRMAPYTPAKLTQREIPFAFTSRGLSSPSEVFGGVRQAIDAGLSPDGALHALTLGAARIYGVDDRLGSVEAGKMAHLVLATAEPWAEGAEVRAVWVDGRLYLQRVAEESTEDADESTGDADESAGDAEESTDDAEESTDDADESTDDADESTGDADESTDGADESTDGADESTDDADESTGDADESTDDTDESTGDAGEAEDEAPEVTEEAMREALAVYQGPVREMGSFAVTNARVYTLDGEQDVLESGTVLVEGGQIVAVGAEVEIPEGVEVIDAEGGSLIPGIIDAHTHICIEGGGNEGTVVVSAMVTTQDILNPDDIAIYRALAGGVTTVNVLHGSSNPIGGGNAVIKLRWGQDAEGLRLRGAPEGIKFALGENPKRSRMPAGIPKRYPATRMGVMDVIHQAFTDARAYQKEWQDYEAAKQAARQSSKQRRRGESAQPEPIPPRRDRKLENLAQILDGTRLVHAHSYRADEILQLLRLAEELGFRIATLQHVLEGYRVADEIAAHGAGASTFSDWWGFKMEAAEAIPYNAALMEERGVLVTINSDSAEEMRHLNLEAAKMMKWGGVDEVSALAMVTLNAAKQLGIEDRVGSIEVGKDADLVLYDGSPMSIRSVVQKTFVDGHLYFDREADRQRQAKIDEMRELLDPKDDKGDEGTVSGAPSKVTWRHMDYTCREHMH